MFLLPQALFLQDSDQQKVQQNSLQEADQEQDLQVREERKGKNQKEKEWCTQLFER